MQAAVLTSVCFVLGMYSSLIFQALQSALPLFKISHRQFAVATSTYFLHSRCRGRCPYREYDDPHQRTRLPSTPLFPRGYELCIFGMSERAWTRLVLLQLLLLQIAAFLRY